MKRVLSLLLSLALILLAGCAPIYKGESTETHAVASETLSPAFPSDNPTEPPVSQEPTVETTERPTSSPSEKSEPSPTRKPTPAPTERPTTAPAEKPTPTPIPIVKDNDEKTTTVYITKTGKKYHTSSCRYLKKSKMAISLDEAKRKYSPCSVCNPPR